MGRFMRCGVVCYAVKQHSPLSASTQTSPAISVGSRAHLQEDAVANVCVCACVSLRLLVYRLV